MVAGLMTSIVDAIMNGPEGGSYASLTIAGVDPNNPSKIYQPGIDPGDDFDFSERALQYWPESIQDTIDIGWSLKDVGGASHALAQWSSNNGRTISFTVQLSRFMMPTDTRTAKEKYLAFLSKPGSDYPTDNRPYNVDIKEQIKFLRGFCYPTYKSISGVKIALPPPVLILSVPNLGLNESGGDSIFCIMTGCDVTYTLLFRDGNPRRATVALTLRQIVQTSNGILFKGFKDAPSKYSMSTSEDLNKNAGRHINGIDPSKVR
jgi:hypothetical protein